MPQLSTQRCCEIIAISLLICSGVTPAGAQTCAGNSPAFPVPNELWPSGFRPGNPGIQLPSNRDSSDYNTQFDPNFINGFELFKDVAVLDDRLYVAYGVGFSVWNAAGANAEDPQSTGAVRDIYLPGHYLFTPDAFEDSDFHDEIAVVEESASQVVIALSGRNLIGFTLWTYNPNNHELSQVYQANGNNSYQVRLIEHTDGRLYAFASYDDGVHVFDASAALALGSPCLDSFQTPQVDCPGVYVGNVGTVTSNRFIDVLQTSTGKILVSASRGFSVGPELEIWEVPAPSAPGTAIRRFRGVNKNIKGTAMWEQGGHAYIAALDQDDDRLKIFNMTACLSGNCTLGSPLSTRPLLNFSSNQFLSFSRSEGDPFIYYGGVINEAQGDSIEFLLNLAALQPTGGGQQLPEITDGGASYFDTCAGTDVHYWGWYYERNEDGLGNVAPRRGRFNGAYFYRAAHGIFDVHVRDPINEEPSITTIANTPPPHFMEQTLGFSATVENCTPDPGGWSWQTDDTVGADIDANGSTASISFDLCVSSDCPSRDIEVTASNSGCPTAVLGSANVTVEEPRAQIRQIDVLPAGGDFPVCTELTFTADLDGQPPFTYGWQAKDDGGTVLESGNSAAFVWDTSEVVIEQPPEIFADGFESGDVSRWGAEAPKSVVGIQGTRFAKILGDLIEGGIGSADFDIELEVTNLAGSHTTSAAVPITLNALGDLGFGSPVLFQSDLGGGSFAFTANTENATEWRWIVEDPANGTSSLCAPASYARCTIFEWSSQSLVGYSYGPPNMPGTYGVTLQARNCLPEAPIAAEVPVEVTEVEQPADPVVEEFDVDVLASIPPCDNFCALSDTCSCPVDEPITFKVTAVGDPDSFQLDWEGDGVFEQTLPSGSTISHTYTSVGLRTPVIRAVRGAQTSDSVSLQRLLDIFQP